jgi:hypothetical protein
MSALVLCSGLQPFDGWRLTQEIKSNQHDVHPTYYYNKHLDRMSKNTPELQTSYSVGTVGVSLIGKATST